MDETNNNAETKWATSAETTASSMEYIIQFIQHPQQQVG